MNRSGGQCGWLFSPHSVLRRNVCVLFTVHANSCCCGLGAKGASAKWHRAPSHQLPKPIEPRPPPVPAPQRLIWPSSGTEKSLPSISSTIAPQHILPLRTTKMAPQPVRMPVNRSIGNTVQKFNEQQKKEEDAAKKVYGDRHFAGTEKFSKDAKDYGRPLVGTKSQARGVKAGNYIMREVMFLCEMIEKSGVGTPPNCFIKFGPLFYSYAHYSENLNGMLIRARKYGLVEFEGEMLYQRQDDHKLIRLLKSSAEIQNSLEYSGDPVNCIKIKEDTKEKEK